jgi:hypothetical protein
MEEPHKKESENQDNKGKDSIDTKTNSNVLTIKVTGQDGNEIDFRVKKNTNFSKIKRAFSDRKGISPTAIRLLFEGTTISDEATPEKLGMEDGDMVDVMFEQTGGTRERRIK